MDELDERNAVSADRFSSWECECINSVENGDEVEHQIEREKAVCSQKLWHCFQNSACCVAQLYKEGGVALWSPFQNAASGVTSLYKETTESQKKFAELGYQSGVHRRNKEILAWVKKRKRGIRREDLIAMLTGNHHHHYPYLHRNSWNGPRQRLPSEQSANNSLSGGIRTPPHNVTLTRLTLSENNDTANPEGDGDLQTFREALALSGIRNTATQSTGNRRMLSARSVATIPEGSAGASLAELNAFITEEFTRHVESRKRPSSTDVIMDSPTHKRSKLL